MTGSNEFYEGRRLDTGRIRREYLKFLIEEKAAIQKKKKEEKAKLRREREERGEVVTPEPEEAQG